MAIDLPPTGAYADIQPEMQIEKRGRKRAALAIGAIIILSDGSECQIVAFDAQGRPLCAPVQP
jgi:hypothetical protein